MKTKLKVLISNPDGELLDSFWAIAHSDADIRNVISDQLNIFDDEVEADYCVQHEKLSLDEVLDEVAAFEKSL